MTDETDEFDGELLEPPTRVFLVNPGDIVLFGNVGAMTAQEADRAREIITKMLGVRSIFFTEDVDMRTLPMEELERLLISVIEMRKQEAMEVKYCNWCEDPNNPDPAHHPDGKAEHRKVAL